MSLVGDTSRGSFELVSSCHQASAPMFFQMGTGTLQNFAGDVSSRILVARLLARASSQLKTERTENGFHLMDPQTLLIKNRTFYCESLLQFHGCLVDRSREGLSDREAEWSRCCAVTFIFAKDTACRVEVELSLRRGSTSWFESGSASKKDEIQYLTAYYLIFMKTSVGSLESGSSKDQLR